jgi:anaerobic ribonucleoside-triphosphate reductase activating protein
MCDRNIKVAGIVNDSITDGPGMRFTLFVQGCPKRCPGCHNPQTHDFEAGQYRTIEDIFKQIQANPLLSGVTLSGGEPFCQSKPLIALCEKIIESGLEIAIYTGETFEELIAENDPDKIKLLSLCDILVDGAFMLEQRNLALLFRGSENQRILNVKESFAQKHAVAEKSERWGYTEETKDREKSNV